MNKTIRTVIVCLLNAFAIACFTYLAVKFNHWWIVFGALLFRFTIHEEESEALGDEEI